MRKKQKGGQSETERTAKVKTLGKKQLIGKRQCNSQRKSQCRDESIKRGITDTREQ